MERQPYSNVPVYVVHPRDGKGCSQTLHRNYLLPISPTLGQTEKDTPVAGAEHASTSALAPSGDSEPADAALSWMPHQTQQVICLRVVRINLLHSDVAHIQPRINFHGGPRTLHYWQISACPASGMYGLVCVFVYMLYHVYTLFSWDV